MRTACACGVLALLLAGAPGAARAVTDFGGGAGNDLPSIVLPGNTFMADADALFLETHGSSGMLSGRQAGFVDASFPGMQAPSVQGPPIARVRLGADGADGASADTANRAFAAVPEPGEWALLVAGFGTAGAVLWRLRHRPR